jgi:hypothetical protein
MHVLLLHHQMHAVPLARYLTKKAQIRSRGSPCRCVVETDALGQIFLSVHKFPPSTVIPPMLDIHTSTANAAEVKSLNTLQIPPLVHNAVRLTSHQMCILEVLSSGKVGEDRRRIKLFCLLSYCGYRGKRVT